MGVFENLGRRIFRRVAMAVGCVGHFCGTAALAQSKPEPYCTNDEFSVDVVKWAVLSEHPSNLFAVTAAAV